MSLGTMRQELLGIPGVNFGLATTKINEALAAVQNENVWSFQLQQNGWLTPGLLGGPNTAFQSPGTITVTPFTNLIYGDAVATATWNASVFSPPFLTQQQIRVPYFSLYNIVAIGPGPAVSYVTVTYPGLVQTPGTYVVNATNSPGDVTGFGAQALITVARDGTVPTAPVVVNGGQGYTLPPIFTLAAGGAPASFQSVLQAMLTIDRPWMEPAQINSSYMIYQAYFAAPPGFKRWYYLSDTSNNRGMNWWSMTQIDLSEEDSERTQFDQPTNVVPYQQDTRQGSATYGQMLFELWPHPISQLPYTFGCEANWPPLQAPGDAVPFPLTDELIKMRAYEMLYLWKESQKGDGMERGSGANWQFLAQALRGEYDDRLKRVRNMDRNLVDLYFTRARSMPGAGQVYATVNSQANVGGWDS
jgi:hypothetical protein